MRTNFVLSFLAVTLCASFGQAASPTCEEALVRATYNHISSDHLDWRLALLVTQSEYDEIKHDAGANAVIYGIPVGATYDDFQKRIRTYQSSTNASLTHDQALNILWTGLDPNSPNAYSECLRTQVLSLGGLHLTVKSATASDIVLVATWRPEGKNAPLTIQPQWTWLNASTTNLPKQLTSGQTTVVVQRPKQQKTLAVNYPGFGDSVTLDPLPPALKPPAEVKMVVTTETYSREVASGQCKDFGANQTVESETKPETWTIVHSEFHVGGADRSCGAYTNCTQTVGTAHKVTWVFNTQGHNEECGSHGNTGIHNSTGTLTVVWQHPQ
jgi:hypothetical protein